MSPTAVIEPAPRIDSEGAVAPAPVLVVDDHPALRRGVGAMLEAEPGLGPVVAVASAAEALAELERLEPSVAVLDYHLPDEDGLSLCLRVNSLPAPPATLIYSAFADEYLVPLALIAGADGLLSKDADPDQLCSAASRLASGGGELPAASPSAMETAASRLDPEDLPILGMLAHGTPAEEIAATLGIEPDWLISRRWAMLERLRGGPARRAQQLDAIRGASAPARS